MALLTKEMFQELKSELFEVPREAVEILEGYEVYVSALGAKASFDVFLNNSEEGSNNMDLFDLVRLCTLDGEGNNLFDTVDEVRRLPAPIFMILVNKVTEINKVLNADEAIEEAEKNLVEADS